MTLRTGTLSLIALLCFCTVAAFAQDTDAEPTGGMVNETPNAWFVELSSPPTADGTALSTTRAEKAAFRKAAKAAGVSFKERYAFDTLFNGISLQVPLEQVPKLSRVAGVKRVWPVVEVLPASAEPSPNLFTAINMTGADIAQNDLGLSGRGVRVGVIDSGIDYNHPDLGTCFGEGCRVSFGYDFVGDNYDSATGVAPVPDSNPDDCADPTAPARGGARFAGGHGTHVAGIVGANGTVKGVAPGVVFGAYRVFGCIGSTSADIMIAAMERALADRMNVVNMSIGSSYQWPDYPTAEAADRLVNKGVVVVTSIGNSGATGLYSAGAPGVSKKVIGVASADNTHVRLPYFTISPDDTQIGYIAASGVPAPPTSGSFPIVATGTPTSAADACSALPAGSLSGKVALIRRGTCGFHVKALNAQNAGAAGVVLYNNVAGYVNANAAGTPAVTIPVVGTSDVLGVLVYNRIQAGGATMTWTAQQGSFSAGANGGFISSFSSYGMAPDLTLKPDITAPGGNIYSTYPLELGTYAVLGGTSMSSPHVAGAAALLLEARPNTPPALVRTLFQNTAEPLLWWGNPPLGFLDNVHRQGAGMLKVVKAIQSKASVEPSKLALGESEAGPQTRTLTIKNSGNNAVTYTLGNVPALSTNANTFAPGATTGFASATFSVPTVTVPAGTSATVDVTITANAALANKALYGGYIVLTGDDGSTLRVPYAGLKGDYQSIQVLAPTTLGFPWLAKLNAGSYQKQADGATFTMTGGDLPYFLIHLDHQSRLMRAEVIDAVSGKNWHRAWQEEYLPRNANNSQTSFFFSFVYDGYTVGGNKLYQVPNGSYVVKVSVLKALGDPNNPAHWETWTSPTFNIARP